MTWQIPSHFDADEPDLRSLCACLETALMEHQLAEIYASEQIILLAYSGNQGQIAPHTITEIHLAWLKTRCLEIIKELSQQRDNRQKFERAVQALFDDNNPDARSFCSNIARTLRQFRLSGAYEVREIIAEAYARGVKYIESGSRIDIPLAWLRSACLNVIREFRQKQNKADKPRIDNEGFIRGDAVFSDLMLLEDRKAIRLSLQKLNADEIRLLCLRVFERKSWEAIGKDLAGLGEPALCANTVRQRGYRVLQKLRQYYDDIRPEVKILEDDIEILSDWDRNCE